jgi:hypothetical protein
LLDGQKEMTIKYKIVKALVNTGVSESIISLKAAKGLPLKNKTETKRWSTAAGMLNQLPKQNDLNSVYLSFNPIVRLKNYSTL